MAISAGLGWYSLSGVLLTDLISAEIGTIAFLSNILREILTFLLIPVLAKYLNGYTAIAPAGATSSDTSLSILMKYTDEEVAMMAWHCCNFDPALGSMYFRYPDPDQFHLRIVLSINRAK